MVWQVCICLVICVILWVYCGLVVQLVCCSFCMKCLGLVVLFRVFWQWLLFWRKLMQLWKFCLNDEQEWNVVIFLIVLLFLYLVVRVCVEVLFQWLLVLMLNRLWLLLLFCWWMIDLFQLVFSVVWVIRQWVLMLICLVVFWVIGSMVVMNLLVEVNIDLFLVSGGWVMCWLFWLLMLLVEKLWWFVVGQFCVGRQLFWFRFCIWLVVGEVEGMMLVSMCLVSLFGSVRCFWLSSFELLWLVFGIGRVLLVCVLGLFGQ